MPQRLLFWEAGIYHYLAFVTIAFMLLPMIYCWTSWGAVVSEQGVSAVGRPAAQLASVFVTV